MAVFNKFQSFVEAIDEKVHNFQTDVLKVALSDVAPIATNTQLSNVTQIAAGNGYVSGGNTATLVSSSQTSGTYKLVLNIVVFTAAGGSIAQFRYVVLYNSSATNSELIGWYDFGQEVIITSGNTFTVAFDQINGVLQLA